MPEDFFFNEFRKGIEAIGCTVLILRPMLQPVALTRSWCCWEIFCTIDADLQFETALSRRDQRTGSTHSMTTSMECDVELAQAWSKNDKDTILAACESVFEVLRRCQQGHQARLFARSGAKSHRCP